MVKKLSALVAGIGMLASVAGVRAGELPDYVSIGKLSVVDVGGKKLVDVHVGEKNFLGGYVTRDVSGPDGAVFYTKGVLSDMGPLVDNEFSVAARVDKDGSRDAAVYGSASSRLDLEKPWKAGVSLYYKNTSDLDGAALAAFLGFGPLTLSALYNSGYYRDGENIERMGVGLDLGKVLGFKFYVGGKHDFVNREDELTFSFRKKF